MLVFNGSHMAILIMSRGPAASSGLVFLKEIAAIDLMSVYLQYEFVQQVRRELHIAFARPEELVEPVVRLCFTGVPMISEVSRQALR